MCGMGVSSLMAVISSPAVCRERIAASRPGPGPLTETSTRCIPCSIAAFAQASLEIWAAYGVDFRLPLNPRAPALVHAIALPLGSVMVTIVLLKVEWICATPDGIFFLVRFLLLALRAILLSSYFFFLATVLRGPLRVRALLRVFCPRTGSLRR